MKILKLVSALLLLTWVSSANATLIFDFSFTDTTNGNNFVTGEILGLSDNATGAALNLRVLTNSSGFGIGEYIGNPNENVFTVANGVITFMDFLSFGIDNDPPDVTDSSLRLSTDFGAGLDHYGSGVTSNPLDVQRFEMSLRSVDVPEPRMAILLLLGLAGLSFARYRRQP